MALSSSQPNWINRWQKHWETVPLPATEESILFRVLVQGLVSIGIIATDVAAQTTWSLWAIPLGGIGAYWSWRRRKHRNVALKFSLAIAMLAVLLIFLNNLVTDFGDSRITLAGLLVQLQVLHSFDLPRRKDLGYSMAIGLILLGVAGTISQNMAFAPWLIVFLGVALPTLVLDYRSRLGLASLDSYFGGFSRRTSAPTASRRPPSPLIPRRLVTLLGLTLLLGLLIFVLIPRLPSYQLQTFPVNAPESTKNQEFDPQNRGIVNPGYVNPGRTGPGNGQGTSPLEGAGPLDDTFYYGFNNRINQNLRGEMKKQLVLRVRSQAEGFWRALTFDHYTGQGWEISDGDDLATLRRPDWSYRFNLEGDFSRLETQKVIQTYTAVMDLPNVIPNLYSARYLYFPTKEVALDRNGSLRAPVGLAEGLTYTVISEVPFRDRTQLSQAPTRYSSVLDRYRQLPPDLKAKVRQQAQALLQKSPRPLNSVYEISLYLAQALKQNYRIRTDIPFLEPGEDLVEAFLFKYQGGYPDHFSTVLTVMLRSLDIPARFTVGFAPGQFNPFTGYYLVHNTDAYGLTEVYFPSYGWFTFDPIPGHDLYPPSIEESETFSVLKQFWQWIAGWLPSPVTNFVSLVWTNLIESLLNVVQWFWQLVSGSFLGAIVGLMLVSGLGLLAWLGWQQARRGLQQRRLARLSPLVRCYSLLLLNLAAQGHPRKSPSQTPGEYIQGLRADLTPEQWALVAEITQAYIAGYYGGQTQNLVHLEQQRRQLQRSLSRRQSSLGQNFSRWRFIRLS